MISLSYGVKRIGKQHQSGTFRIRFVKVCPISRSTISNWNQRLLFTPTPKPLSTPTQSKSLGNCYKHSHSSMGTRTGFGLSTIQGWCYARELQRWMPAISDGLKFYFHTQHRKDLLDPITTWAKGSKATEMTQTYLHFWIWTKADFMIFFSLKFKSVPRIAINSIRL